MTHSSDTPSISKPDEPLTPTQFETLDKALKALVSLIMPLHQLLEAQSRVDDDVTARLEQVIEALAAISASLRTAATMLNEAKLSEADYFQRIEKQLARLVEHQIGRDARMQNIESRLEMLIGWLGARPPQ